MAKGSNPRQPGIGSIDLASSQQKRGSKRQPIQLDRQFLRLSDEASDEGIDRRFAAYGLAKELSWSEVLAYPCAVILGEAGTGKTTEFRQRCKLLAREGLDAFYVTVQDLATQGFIGSQRSELQRRFTTWSTSDAPGYFFVDAVDEARLHGQTPTIAVTKLEQALGTNVNRAHILISCRVSDWRAHADREAIQSILFPTKSGELVEEVDVQASQPVESWDDEEVVAATATKTAVPQQRSASKVEVFALAPLDAPRIEALARSLGVNEPGPFMTAARHAAAFAFLERPRDVEWVVEYWLERRQFGTLTDLVENDVRQKLVERNPNYRNELPPMRARAAVEVLAGICSLERRSMLRLPDEQLDPEWAAVALDPALLLPDFSTKQLGELLALPIFDEATYGRVRIHHRTVAEYLGAQWLQTLLTAGLASSEVEDLLLRQSPNGQVVPKELRAIAAWFAGTNASFRKRLLEVAPTVMLEGGDPGQLPDEDRRQLLRALANQYTARKRLFKDFDAEALKRLASPGIVATVHDLLSSFSNDELLDTLLTIVAEGKLVDCASDVLGLAVGTSTPRRARHEAVRALAKVGTSAQIEDLLRTLVDQATEIDHDVAGTLLATFHPKSLNTDRLLLLLSRVRPPSPQTSTVLPYFLGRKVYGDTAPEDRERLIRGIYEIVSHGADPDEEISKSWLLEPLAKLLVQFGSGKSPDDIETIRPVIRFFTSLSIRSRHDGEHDQGSAEIRRFSESSAAVRRVMFWEHVDLVRRQKPKISRYLELSGTHSLWSLSADDLSWLTTDARERGDVRDRLLAFDALVTLANRSPQKTHVEVLVRPLIAADAALASRWKRYGANESISPGTPMWELEQRVMDSRRKRRRDNDLQWLHEHLDGLRTGRLGNALTLLAQASNLDPQEPNKAIAKLSKDYDADVASAAREGWRNMWRTLPCRLPHEEPEPNRFLVSMLAGFAGITIEFEDGLDAARLSTTDAISAARYASRAMNTFPSWLDVLATEQPAAVAQVFGECIEAEFARPANAQPSYNVLHLLSNASGVVRELCAPLLLDRLAEKEPDRLDVVEASIEALIAIPRLSDQLTAIAAKRCASVRDDADRFSLWWCALLAVSPSTSLAELRAVLGAQGPAADARVLSLCDRLWRIAEDRRHAFPFPKDAATLSGLVEIVFHHVRPDEDLRHEGVYHPGPRDNAESLRRYLLDLLAAIPGEETYVGLRRIADDPVLATSRDWLLSLADERAGLDASALNPTVADRLVGAYRRYGLAAVDHLDDAGLKTVRSADVDFAILTALPEERDAVLTALGAAVKLDKDGSDTHTYYEATVQTTRADRARYRVIVTCCPTMGPQVAVATTAALLHRWRPRHVVLVGIAMGIAGETKHGDVLVSEQVADYTLGKKEGGKDREIRWKAHSSGASLFESSKSVTKSWAKNIKATRPGPGEPDVVFGVIASGGDVVADDDVVTQFQKHWPKLIGIEMEAGGASTAVHDDASKPDFLMIKAVSDHGSDKKDPRVVPWREYAYFAAATFAVELIRSGPAPSASHAHLRDQEARPSSGGAGGGFGEGGRGGGPGAGGGGGGAGWGPGGRGGDAGPYGGGGGGGGAAGEFGHGGGGEGGRGPGAGGGGGGGGPPLLPALTRMAAVTGIPLEKLLHHHAGLEPGDPRLLYGARGGNGGGGGPGGAGGGEGGGGPSMEAPEVHGGPNGAVGTSGSALTFTPDERARMFGDGSDGDAFFDGNGEPIGSKKVSATSYVLTRDVQYSDATIASGITLRPQGFIVRVSGTLTNDGVISANGDDAPGANATTQVGGPDHASSQKPVRSQLRTLRVLVVYGGDSATFPRSELLAWLRGPYVGVDARVVSEAPPHSLGSIDDRVDAAMDWADKAIAIITPDDRSPYGAPNVIDEIGRWRSSKGKHTLCILRQKSVPPYSNHSGLVYVGFDSRVSERFEDLRRFLFEDARGGSAERGNRSQRPAMLVPLFMAIVFAVGTLLLLYLLLRHREAPRHATDQSVATPKNASEDGPGNGTDDLRKDEPLVPTEEHHASTQPDRSPVTPGSSPASHALTALSDGERYALSRRLGEISGHRVDLVLIGTAPQARIAFEQLGDVFKEANWTLNNVTTIGQAVVVGQTLPTGSYLTSPDIGAKVVTDVFASFASVGVNVPIAPGAPTFASPTRPPAEVVIVVQ